MNDKLIDDVIKAVNSGLEVDGLYFDPDANIVISINTIVCYVKLLLTAQQQTSTYWHPDQSTGHPDVYKRQVNDNTHELPEHAD